MKTTRYTKNFIVSLTILPTLISIVIMLVNGNLGTSVAVLGAFSLIRFRSIPGNSIEIVSVFFAMAIGLAIGMGAVIFAIVMTIFICLLLLILSKINLGSSSREQVLKITIPEHLDYTNMFDDLFAAYTTQHQLIQSKTTNMGSLFECTYLIRLGDDKKEKEFMDEIRIRNGNLKVALSQTLIENEL